MCRFNLPKISRIKGIFLSLLVCFCVLNAPGYAQNCPGCGDCGPVGCSAFCVALPTLRKLRAVTDFTVIIKEFYKFLTTSCYYIGCFL